MKRSKWRWKIKGKLFTFCLLFALSSLTCAQASKAKLGHPQKGPGTHEKARQDKAQVLTGPVIAVRIDSAINPASLELLKRGINKARRERASLFLIILDTPGGLVTSVRKMIQLVMSSPVPVAVFVYPPGARAASAGALLTLSADIAAMAPGTNIGAAHPVTIGKEMEANSTMSRKVENDLAALAVSIAMKRGRNAKWAEEAVRKSVSAPAQEALKLHVIDLIARDVPDLMKKLKKHPIRLSDGRMVVVAPRNPNPLFLKESIREKVLKVIADPNIAYILLMIGMVGLYFELAHPGVILPGSVGSICLLLALYALHTLSASTTAVLLILLAFVLFVLELFITSHGILAISGAIALAIGSLMLFDSHGTIYISASVLWPTLLFVILFFVTIAILAARATLSRPKTGLEALLGEPGVVKKRLSNNRFQVFVHGELWEALGPKDLKEGQEIEVSGVRGLRLEIKPKEE